MNRRYRAVVVAVVVAVLGFLFAPQGPFGSIVWPEPAHGAAPSSVQLPLFVTLGLLETITMGIGVAFFVFGWTYSRRVFSETPRLAPIAHVSIAWLLASWWLHDNLHMVLGSENLWYLLALEYGFHVTLMIAGIVLASGVYLGSRSKPIPLSHDTTEEIAPGD